jgi:MFS family permease
VSSAQSYLALVRVAPARRLIYALGAACISFGMLPLAILLTVQRATGSYPNGGYAVAAFGVAAGLSAPFRGRLVDRRGARRWLPGFSCASSVFLVALALLGGLSAPAWALVVLAGLAGVTAPPLFASARAVWPHAVEPPLVRRGYAVTSLIHDVGQVAGPALAGLLFVVDGWAALPLCGAAMILAAVLSVARTGGEAPRPAPRPMPRLRGNRALTGLLVLSVLVGLSVGLVQVAVPTLAASWDASSTAGPLLAAFALGSVVGALWFGGRSWRGRVLRRYLLCVLALGLLLAPLALATTPLALAPGLLVAGLAFGPATVSVFESLDVLAPGSGAEALTWVTTAEASGWAAGSAAASPLVLHVGTWAPFVIASLALVVPAGLVLALRARAR